MAASHPAVHAAYAEHAAGDVTETGVAASIMRALEGAAIRPTVKGKGMTITKMDGTSVVFKTSSSELFAAYWDILRATDPLLEAILAVGKISRIAVAGSQLLITKKHYQSSQGLYLLIIK